MKMNGQNSLYNRIVELSVPGSFAGCFDRFAESQALRRDFG
jgi:hypothetical protein